MAARYDRVFRSAGVVTPAVDEEAPADIISRTSFRTLMFTLSKAVAVKLDRLARRHDPTASTPIQLGDGARLLCRASRYLPQLCDTYPEVLALFTELGELSDIDLESVPGVEEVVASVDRDFVLPFLEYFTNTERLDAAGRAHEQDAQSRRVGMQYRRLTSASDEEWEAILRDRQFDDVSARAAWIRAVSRAVRAEDVRESQLLTRRQRR